MTISHGFRYSRKVGFYQRYFKDIKMKVLQMVSVIFASHFGWLRKRFRLGRCGTNFFTDMLVNFIGN